MPAPSPTQQPPLSTIQIVPGAASHNSWITYMLAGLSAPGSIPIGGVRGFRRKTGWDIKKGKGTLGATLTLKDVPPVEGTIVSQLFTAADFTAWDEFVEQVLAISATVTQAQGLPIYYPQFSAIGLTTVVVQHFTGPEPVGKGMYHATVELIEWSPPPALSVVQTVASTSPDQTPPGQPTPPDPRIAARQAQIQQLQAAAYSAGGGGSQF